MVASWSHSHSNMPAIPSTLKAHSSQLFPTATSEMIAMTAAFYSTSSQERRRIPEPRLRIPEPHSPPGYLDLGAHRDP